MQSEIKHFNIRVYALIFDGHGNVLLSDEVQLNNRMSKFPGGGLEFGEGTLECQPNMNNLIGPGFPFTAQE